MTAGQEKRELSKEFENDGVSISAASSVTFNMGSGDDTATNRYLDLESGKSFGIEVIPTVACSITNINGIDLKVAISVGTLGWRMSTGVFSSITILAGTATDVEVFGKN
jgi:hypothetical protein